MNHGIHRIHGTGKTLAECGLALPPVRGKALVRGQESGGRGQGNPELMRFITPAAQARWMGAGIAWYSPQRVEMVFRQALAGDLQSQWEMFDLMEATWPRLSKNLNQLKDDVVAAFQRGDYVVRPFARKGEEPSPEAEDRAELVREACTEMTADPVRDLNGWEDTIRDMMDARGKGLSVLELDFEVRDSSAGLPMMAPRCTRWVHPGWYGYPSGPGDGKLMLRDAAGNWMEFPEHKFIVAVCKSKTGHPLGAATLHTLGFWWAASNFTAEWFLNFAQVFGQPMRWATYDPNMPGGDQAKLEAMLTNMGSAAWGMFPQGTIFELKEVAKGAGDMPQAALLEIADRICDLVILRQTLTSDVSQNAGSRAQGEVHERVLDSAVQACCGWACKCLQPLVRSIVVLNKGNLAECPSWGSKDDKDESKELSEVLVKVAQAGLEPTDEAIPEIGKRLGFGVQRKAAAPAPGLPGVGGDAAGALRDGQDGQDGRNGPANDDAAVKNEEGEPKEEIKAREAQGGLAEGLGVPASWLNPVREFLDELVRKAQDEALSDADLMAFLEKASARVPELFGRMDVDELARTMEIGMGQAVVDAVRKRIRQVPETASQ